MMTDKQYNDFFRHKLDDFSSGVPDRLWQSINAGNQKKKDRVLTITKYVLFFIFLITTIKTADKITMPENNKAIPTGAILSAESNNAVVAAKGNKIKNESAGQQEAGLAKLNHSHSVACEYNGLKTVGKHKLMIHQVL